MLGRYKWCFNLELQPKVESGHGYIFCRFALYFSQLLIDHIPHYRIYIYQKNRINHNIFRIYFNLIVLCLIHILLLYTLILYFYT